LFDDVNLTCSSRHWIGMSPIYN